MVPKYRYFTAQSLTKQSRYATPAKGRKEGEETVRGHYDFDELEAKTPVEKALADRYERLTRAVLRLAELREQRGATQEQLARAMEVSQPFVSKIERNDDWYVSTLSHYVGALGGELRLCAVFPDQQQVDLDVLRGDARAATAV